MLTLMRKRTKIKQVSYVRRLHSDEAQYGNIYGMTIELETA